MTPTQITRRPAHAPRATQPRGFTLLELIVALAMVAIIAASLYAAVRVAYRAQASAESAVELSRTADLAFMFIRADIENAMPPGVLASTMSGTSSSGDTGDNDDLFLYTTADAPQLESANGDIKEVEWTLAVPDDSLTPMASPSSTELLNNGGVPVVTQNNNNQKTSYGSSDGQTALVRRVTRNLMTSNVARVQEQVICRGVTGFNLRYYTGTDWEDTFDGAGNTTNPLPSAVEVTLELERNGQKVRYIRVFRIACSTITPSTSGGM